MSRSFARPFFLSQLRPHTLTFAAVPLRAPVPPLTLHHTRSISCRSAMSKPADTFVLPPDTRVGFIGAGAMANAIAKGIGSFARCIRSQQKA